MDFKAIRREYLKGGLHHDDLTENPLELFARWMQAIRGAVFSCPK